VDYEALRAKNQWTLIGFIDVELKIGRTFIHSATLAHHEGHAEYYEQAKHYATRAADSVRRFMSGVVDDKIRNQIAAQLAELDGLISKL